MLCSSDRTIGCLTSVFNVTKGNLLLIFPPVTQITVYKQSTYNKAYKEGMEVNCKYVKRKQLTNYLSQEDLDKYKPKVEEGQPQTIRQKRKSDVGSQDSPSRESPENNKKPKIDGDLTTQVRNWLFILLFLFVLFNLISD